MPLSLAGRENDETLFPVEYTKPEMIGISDYDEHQEQHNNDKDMKIHDS